MRTIDWGNKVMDVNKKVVQCKKYPITYTLVTKQVKNINMRISSRGEIVVSANPFVPMEKIDDFVSSKASWIIKNLKSIEEKAQHTMIAYHVVWKFIKDTQNNRKI